MILSAVKGLGLTPDYVLYEMSYANLLLYSAAFPVDEDTKESDKKKPLFDASKDANNPNLFKGESDE